MTVCCCTPDEEKQVFGCVLFHFQCGLCPIKCCDYDNDGMCWGCVCCACQKSRVFGMGNLVELIKTESSFPISVLNSICPERKYKNWNFFELQQPTTLRRRR
eukprot:gene29486-38589_t